MLGIGTKKGSAKNAPGAVAAPGKFWETERALRLTGFACLSLFGTVILAVVVRAVAYPQDAAFGAILTGLSVPAAAFAGGVLLGLLFGIPTTGGPDASNAAAPAEKKEGADGDAEAAEAPPPESTTASRTSRIGHNDSLVRVSSWLATVIVGVSLVQLDDMLDRLDVAGRAVSQALLGCSPGCPPQAMDLIVPGTALIIVFLAGGFLFGYLWTRVIFYYELSTLDGAVSANSRATAARAVTEGNVQTPPASVAGDAEVAFAAAAAAPISPSPAVLDSMDLLRARTADIEKEPADSNDPWRGQFGGKSENGGYRLSAEVGRSNVSDYFSVRLRVSRVVPASGAAQEVEFFLHPTFPKPHVKRRLNRRGQADLALLAWGAFTVGARLDNGVELELNLAELSTAPETFRQR